MNSRCRSSLARPQAATDNSGFTLLEVLIAMAVMVFMSFGIYQATSETYRLRDILSTEGDFYNGIRMSMDILGRDFALMYSPQIMMPQKPSPSPTPGGQPLAPFGGQPNSPPTADDKEYQQLLSGDMGRTTQFYGPALDKTGVRAMHFIGKDTQMSFVAVSNIRIYKDAPESEFVKITYSLSKDEGNLAVADAMMLVKTESPDAFDEDERRDATYKKSLPLLHGITQLKILYCIKDKDPCSNSWDSDSADNKNTYPDFIKVNLTVKGRLNLNFEGTYIFRPEVPLRGLDPST